MKDDKNQVLYIIFGMIIIILLGVYLLLNNQKEDSELAISNTASDISSKYEDIDYGTSETLYNEEITKGGSYTISGEHNAIIINTDENVQLILSNATITSTNTPAIYIMEAKNVSIVLEGENTLNAKTTEDLDGAIYSKADLIFSGDGKLIVTSNYDGIVSKDTLVIQSGTYVIESKDDGIRGKDEIAITNGVFTITSGGDGIKSTNEEDENKGYIAIDGGTFTINSVSDAIQAETSLTITDGEFNIKTTGTGNISSKGIKANTMLTIDGGIMNLNVTDDGIHSNGNIIINKGEFTIVSREDAIHADGLAEINGGTLAITAKEGIEATYVKIDDGDINISASDDGINAGNKSNTYKVMIEINGGNITIKMGQGDTDGVDSNGDIVINGGTISVTGQSTFDYDGEGIINGGIVICNGEKVTTLPNQFMGGGMNNRRMR